ncbi:uncharacterized protein JCM10292_003824 [Rhodotorula paludigena]|uniref:uncharacterized protein n=1 Tax=Rhodotorula paludigena TaxID=86838 RepID=UPI0031799B2D
MAVGLRDKAKEETPEADSLVEQSNRGGNVQQPPTSPRRSPTLAFRTVSPSVAPAEVRDYLRTPSPTQRQQQQQQQQPQQSRQPDREQEQQQQGGDEQPCEQDPLDRLSALERRFVRAETERAEDRAAVEELRRGNEQIVGMLRELNRQFRSDFSSRSKGGAKE